MNDETIPNDNATPTADDNLFNGNFILLSHVGL